MTTSATFTDATTTASRSPHGGHLRAAEDFVDRFTNVPIAGLQYDFFVPDTCGNTRAISLNTRVYPASSSTTTRSTTPLAQQVQ